MPVKTASNESIKNRRLPVGLTFEQIAEAVKKLGNKERESFLEDLLAATSPGYLSSISESREDYRQGRCKRHQEMGAIHPTTPRRWPSDRSSRYGLQPTRRAIVSGPGGATKIS
jgi:hypothetical protein